MGTFTQIGETEPLFKNKKNDVKCHGILFTWNFSIILFVVLLLGVVYLLYMLIDNEIQPEFDKTVNTRNPLHVSSIATTNDDYFVRCAPRVKCDPNAKYRSLNGSCNNLRTPAWGAATTPFLRMFNANFNDGYYELRAQTNGSALPSARVVSLRLFLNRETYRMDENNVLLLPFGQLVAHDVSGLPNDVPKTRHGQTIIDCCTDENARKTFSQCQLVVENPPDDPVYGEHNVSCMGTVRSVTSRNYSCPLYPTTFINHNTQFIDASEVYGSSESMALRLRAMDGGRLNFSTGSNGQMFCPYQKLVQNKPLQLSDTGIQYDTGDPDNGNQNLGITAMQTLFLRYHNYIAFQLSALNPSWSDEIVYQESRRIVIGTIQRVVYEDFLPIIIGEDFQQLYGLNDENIYDPTINPSTSQEFSSAAYRVLHTIIPVQFNFMKNDYEIESSMKITDWMKRPDLLPIDDHFDELFKGFLETPGRVPQPSYNYYISNFMFHLYFEPQYTGLDLLSVDIARGRDVGLQPYNRVREFCGLPLANDFEDLMDSMHIKHIKTLKELYHSVDDIDLMVGLLLENLSDGAMVGPTARCLIADGFYRYKAGDRFFYDVRGQPGSFTPDQLKTIKKITLGHVLCATSNVDRVQRDIFKTVDHNLFPTSKLKCDGEFDLDLSAWEQSNSRFEL